MRGFRWFPAIVGGFLVGLFIYFLTSMIATTPQIWSLLAGWIVAGVWFGRSGIFAWPRTWICLAVLSFALPLVSLVFSGRLAAEAVSTASGDIEAAGAAIGSTIGGAMVTGAAAIVGFFLGIIFAIVAYFTFRHARDQAQAAKAK